MATKNLGARPSSNKPRRKTRFAFDKNDFSPRHSTLPADVKRTLHAANAPEEFKRFFSLFGDRTWTSHLGASDLLAVLSADGELSERVRREVNSIRMFECEGTTKVGCVVVEVKSTADARLFGRLLDILGTSLVSVALDYEPVRTYSVSSLPERCRFIKSLTLVDKLSEIDLSALLRYCGSRLTHLELEGSRLRDSHVNAITENCTRIESLRIVYDEWDSIILSPWGAIGETITKLALKCPALLLNNSSAQVELLTEMKENCSGLIDIELIYPLYSDFSFSVALCKLLGEMLLSFTLKADEVLVKKADIAKIFAACPNVIIDADIWHEERPFRLQNANCLPA